MIAYLDGEWLLYTTLRFQRDGGNTCLAAISCRGESASIAFSHWTPGRSDNPRITTGINWHKLAVAGHLAHWQKCGKPENGNTVKAMNK